MSISYQCHHLNIFGSNRLADTATKFQGNQPFGSKQGDFVKVFTIYVLGGPAVCKEMSLKMLNLCELGPRSMKDLDF